MLLLAYFVLLHIGDERMVMAGAHAAFSGKPAAGPLFDAPAASMFEPGEARLKPDARRRLAEAGRKAASAKARLIVAEHRPGGRRQPLRRLGARRRPRRRRRRARSRARAMKESDIEIVMPPSRAAAAGDQRLTVEAV